MIKPFTTYVETGEKKRVFVIIDIDYIIRQDGEKCLLTDDPKNVCLMDVWAETKRWVTGPEFLLFLEKGLMKRITTT